MFALILLSVFIGAGLAYMAVQSSDSPSENDSIM